MPSGTDLRPSFAGQVGAESLKVRRQLSTWLMLGGGVLLFLLVVLAATTASNLKDQLNRSPTAWAYNMVDVFGLMGQIGTGIVVLVVASRLFGMEYSSGTIRVLLARGAGRLQVALAKAVVSVTFGLLVIAVYFLFSAAACLLLAQSITGSISPVTHLPAEFWQDLGRWGVVQVVSILMATLIAWAAAAAGRSLAFAMGAALAVYPATNFLDIIFVLGRQATRHSDPWRQMSDVLLGADINVLLPTWEPAHRAAVAFARPMDTLSLSQVVLALAAYGVIFLAIAIYRTTRPDVLE